MTRQAAGGVILLFVCALLLGAPAVVSGQTPSNQDTLTALLAEVRALRIAMEQMASAGPRIQIAFGRLQLQEGRVQALVRRHADVREQLASVERESESFAAQFERHQEELKQTIDADRRRELERELPFLKTRQEQFAAEIYRLRALEIDLMAQVTSEQNRWAELYSALEELERALKR